MQDFSSEIVKKSFLVPPKKTRKLQSKIRDMEDILYCKMLRKHASRSLPKYFWLRA